MIDSHCHIHSDLFKADANEAIAASKLAGVEQLVCVGCDGPDSQNAVDFAKGKKGVYATIGVHPHEATGSHGLAQLAQVKSLVGHEKVIAVGECGLDYWYLNAPKKDQEIIFRAQLELAINADLPLVFHVRGSKQNPDDVFDDFFRILDEFTGVRGVLHSFTAGQKSLDLALKRGLLIGVNGIVTFCKDEDQLAVYRGIPIDSMVLETDAPYLTPVPKRGIFNSPEYMGYTAQFLADLRGEKLEHITKITTANTKRLFSLIN